MSHPDDNLREQIRQLITHLGESDDEDWFWELVEILAQELLEIKFEQFLGAEPYECSDKREGYRNEY